MKKETIDAESVLSKMDNYFNAAKEILEKYAPDAVDLGLTALRVEALSNILIPLVLLCVSVLYAVKFPKFLKLVEAKRNKYNGGFDDGLAYMCVFMLSTTAITVASILSLVKICSLWNWVGIFYPELYAVHKFLL